MGDFSPFICLPPLTPGVYSQGTEAGTLAFREVESNKGPGPTQFTLTYVLLIGLAILAAESYTLLMIYSSRQTVQDQVVSFGGPKCGTECSIS